MNIPWEHLGAVAACGALGGLAQCAMTGFRIPYYHKKEKTGHFGSFGFIFAGAVAAVVVWCLYGPASSFDTAGKGSFEARIPLLQLASSVLVGFTGGEVLRIEAKRRVLSRQKENENKAKNSLAKTLKLALKDLEDTYHESERETGKTS